MERLAAALVKGGIDTASLAPAFEVERQSICRLTVHGTEAVPLWQRLRKLVARTGHWPILLGTDEDLTILEEGLEGEKPQTVSTILRRAAKVVAAALFDDWQKTAVQNCREAAEEFGSGGDTEVQKKFEARLAQKAPFQGLPRGDWPEVPEPADGFSIPYDVLTHQPLGSVHVGLVPAMNGWEAPAFLNFGSWNACPYPEHHVAVMEYWYRQYGAEVVGITHDIVEMRVARPPRSRKRALELAREQYLYCEDIVDQGTRTLDNLADTLLDGKTWYFWWD
jgi:hypothetical protein